MTALARGYVWYPNLDADIEQLIRDCAVCKTLQHATPHEELVPWSWPTRRWQRIFIDFAKYRGADIMLCQDGHSKWPEAHIMRDLTAATVNEVLRSWFARWGLPEELVCDNGPPFTSAEFSRFLAENGVKLTHTPVYHPQSDGQIERGVGSLKGGLNKQLLDSETSTRTLQHKIDAWLFAYRNTPHTVTKISPAELFLGRRPRTRLSLLSPDNLLKQRMEKVREKTRQAHPGKTTTYRPGDLVWVRNMTHRVLRWQPGTVQAVVSTSSYNVEVSGRVRHVSSSHLQRRSPTARTIEEDPTVRAENVTSAPSVSVPVGPQALLGSYPPAPLAMDVPPPARERPPSPPAVPDPGPPAPVVAEPQAPSTPPSPSSPTVPSGSPATPRIRSRVGRTIYPPKYLSDYVS